VQGDRHLLGYAIRPGESNPFVLLNDAGRLIAFYPYGKGWVPHLLVIGGPGAGKTTFARSLVMDLIRTPGERTIGLADGKEANSFLMYTGQPGIAGVSNASKDTAEMVGAWCEDVRERYKLFSDAKLEVFRTGKAPENYRPPVDSFLLIDEFIPWALSLGDKQRAEVFEALKWGALVGREARAYLRILTQVPYADKSADAGLPSKVKSVLDARIAILGHAGLRPMENRMAFGDDQSKASDRIEKIADQAELFGDQRRGLGMLQVGTKEAAFKGLWTADYLDPETSDTDRQAVLGLLPVRPRPGFLAA
jgi:FtsK/SpoIIIE family